MAAAGISGILLTSPIVDTGKIGRMVALAAAAARRSCSPSASPRQAELLAQAAEAAKVNLDVLVDLDVGDRRTGSLPGEPAVELAKQISQSRNAHASAAFKPMPATPRTPSASRTANASSRQPSPKPSRQAPAAESRLRRQILSGGSTGTYNIDSAIDGMTELQVGSYVFMDVDYRRIGGRDGNAIYTDFQPSLTVLATVVSATHADRVTIDAGTKAVDTTTTQRGPRPRTGLA